MGTKLAIICSHPIQYYAPLFRYLAQTVNLEVIYCHKPTADEIGKSGFGLSFQWDIDLLEGYSYRFIENVAKKPSMDSFFGCDTPNIGTEIQSTKATHVLILGWYLKSYIQALVHCKFKKIPVSVRGDSQLNPNDSGWKYRAKKWLYPLFLRQFTKILYVGERNKAYLLHFGARPNQLLFSPHVVDQGFWKRDPAFPISQKPQITFLWVGKFIEKKRPLDAIAACMNTRNENIRLVMIGTGELWEESKLRASSDSRISFVGFKNQTELKSWYAQADALVLTSDFGETWGLVVNEAFAQGIPAIVSNACGSSQGFVNHRINGFVYPLGDVEKLTQLMEDFAQNYDKWMPVFQQHIPEANSMYSFETNRKAIATFLEVAK